MAPWPRVVVVGPGPIGLLSGLMAKLSGAEVVVVGLAGDRARLDIAEELGCTAMVDGVEEWAYERDGMGCNGVVDCAGVSATLELAINIVRPAGWISKVGWGPQPMGFSLDPMIQKNVTLQIPMTD